MKWFCDVLVVGGGGGAIRAAIAAKEAKPDSRVLLVTKGFFGHSGVTAISCSDRMAFHCARQANAKRLLRELQRAHAR